MIIGNKATKGVEEQTLETFQLDFYPNENMENLTNPIIKGEEISAIVKDDIEYKHDSN